MDGDKEDRNRIGESRLRLNYLKELILFLLGECERFHDVVGGGLNEGGSGSSMVEKLSLWRAVTSDTVSDNHLHFSENVLGIPQQLLLLLKECALLNRWKEVGQVLEVFTGENTGEKIAIWKAGMEVMYLDPVANSSMIAQAVNILLPQDGFPSRELVLEHMLYLMSNGLMSEAKEAFAGTHKGRTSARKPSHQEHQVEFLCKAYQGLIWYWDWINTKQKVEASEKESEENPLNAFSQIGINLRPAMDSYARKSRDLFCSLEKEEGVWDIFLIPYIELLEYCNETRKAKQVLVDYRTKNYENPNAHKYLYQFQLRVGAGSDELTETLQSLAKFVPSDPLVLQLCDRLGTDRIAILKHLFALLDYDCWKHHLEPWRRLSSILVDVYSENETVNQKSIKACWASRANWWPQFHFNPLAVPQIILDDSLEVLTLRAIVAAFLIRLDNPFTKTVEDKVDETRKEKINSVKILISEKNICAC